MTTGNLKAKKILVDEAETKFEVLNLSVLPLWNYNFENLTELLKIQLAMSFYGSQAQPSTTEYQGIQMSIYKNAKTSLRSYQYPP